ncbi:TPR repeat-containing protein DDB_G0287407 isoform X1 [Hydra vulgaris]|uniref:TPR repeat-containing protein DDB_G0287407 isoform X1 n=2 Tax=Hydra vulgaris TaxID=6087 RepID=UPI001F5FC068|nr:TPR repeat-containing protein DDB_G0287407-like isoform X1 [Hydra vulgaris]
MGHIISKKKKQNQLVANESQVSNAAPANIRQNIEAKPKVEIKPETKPEIKPEVKPEIKPEIKPEPKNETIIVNETVSAESVDEPVDDRNSIDSPNCQEILVNDTGPEKVKLSFEEALKLKPTTPEDMWKIVKEMSDDHAIDVKPLTCRKGWKTIRLFVSSTFKDFHQEREVLVKEVFPDLRLWCESRKLRLVECDLRWGVPKDSTSEDTINICLSELDRCYEDNTAPFFLNLAGDRAGWIPTFDEFSYNLALQYGWVYGLTVTEMEIVHGAFRKLNPNALFMLRTVDHKEYIPEDVQKDFFNDEPFLKEKLKTLKSVITDTFPETNVKHYTVSCQKHDENGAWSFTGLSGPDSAFSNTIYDFFQHQIEFLYPLDPSPQDPLQIQREAHETFLDSRSSCVLGRDKLLTQIEYYVINGNLNKSCSPLLVVGIAGAGKSALMAKSAQRAIQLSNKGQILNMKSSKKCNVFFHFVGATPRSTDLASFLQRLTKELRPEMHEVLCDLDALITLSYNLLENPLTDPVIIFIDAVNQMDEDKQQYLNRWLPENLSENVRVVISTIEGTSSHQTLRVFKSSPTEIICGPLDRESRQLIVENILRTYNKRLDEEQLGMLLDKVGSANPLWLTLACEELRVYGKFETLINKIQELPDDLISLEESVFERFESENGGALMKACVCLLEVSRHGLLETELLALLGEEKNIKVPDYNPESEKINELMSNSKNQEEATDAAQLNINATIKTISKRVQDTYVNEDSRENEESTDTKAKQKERAKGKQVNFLPARDWAVIYRNLKPLLRPCGDLGEGRLDFYHRSLSKAARRRYFSGDDENKKHKYNFWHGVLADYFEGVLDVDRKAEELPYHLEQLLDNNRLIRCLMDWDVFERLYSEEFSIDLLHSWLQCGGFRIASAVYREQLGILRQSDIPLVVYVEIVEKVYGFLIQAGQYSEALELMEERLNDELTQLGERPDEMADIYQNMARCKSEIDKAQQYMRPDQLDDNKLIVEYGRKCLAYRQQFNSPDNKYRCALANILISHHLSNVADITHETKPREEAFVAIDAAIEVFTELNDIGHIAECLMTKAIIDFNQPFHIREKLLLQSLEYCIKGYGEKHLLTTRIYLNTGIAYEMAGNRTKAFELFIKLKDTCLAVFGPSHPKTVRAINTLNEPTYKLMAENLARTVPETA